jgi:hypothetical protein
MEVYKGSTGKLNERDNLEVLGVDARIILEWL